MAALADQRPETVLDLSLTTRVERDRTVVALRVVRRVEGWRLRMISVRKSGLGWGKSDPVKGRDRG